MPLGEVAVQVESAEEPFSKTPVLPRAAPVEHPEEPGPGQDPKGGLHGAGPVHGLGIGIGLDPALQKGPHRLGVSLVTGEEVGLASRHQPLQPRELPRNFHIARVPRVHVGDVAHVARRPSHARFVVEQPIHIRPQLDRPHPKERDAAGERVFGGIVNTLSIVRAHAFVVAGINRCGAGGVRAPRKLLPQRIEIRGARCPQQRSLVEAPCSARGEDSLDPGLDLVPQSTGNHPGWHPQGSEHARRERSSHLVRPALAARLPPG